MAAIVRVKRRRDEESAESLFIVCKKTKTDEKIGEIKPLLKFAGTVNARGDEVATQFVQQAIRRDKLKNEYKRHVVDRETKRNAARTQITTTGRCKIVAKKRALNFQALQLDEESEGANNSTKQYLLYDAEIESSVIQPVAKEELTCNGLPMVRTKTAASAVGQVQKFPVDQFVYDLYYMNKVDFDYRSLEDALAVELIKEECVDGSEDGGEEDLSRDLEDDENEECNWRNDYPDEDPMYYESIDADYFSGKDGKLLGDELNDDLDRLLNLGDESSNDDDDVTNDALYIDEILTTEVEQFGKMPKEKWKALTDFYEAQMSNS